MQGNFTLEFTNIVGADAIKVYKIDPTTDPPNQWIELDYTTTVDTVRFTMSVGDPPVVFAAPPTPPPPKPVGGIIVPVNKFELLAPWLGLASLMAMAVAAVVFKKR